jgi:hypothetical protein
MFFHDMLHVEKSGRVFPQTSAGLEPLCKQARDLSVKTFTPSFEWIPKLWPAFVMRERQHQVQAPISKLQTTHHTTPRHIDTRQSTPYHSALNINPPKFNDSKQSLHAPRPLATMPSERDYQISPLVQESIIHNTRVRYLSLPRYP